MPTPAINGLSLTELVQLGRLHDLLKNGRRKDAISLSYEWVKTGQLNLKTYRAFVDVLADCYWDI